MQRRCTHCVGRWHCICLPGLRLVVCCQYSAWHDNCRETGETWERHWRTYCPLSKQDPTKQNKNKHSSVLSVYFIRKRLGHPAKSYKLIEGKSRLYPFNKYLFLEPMIWMKLSNMDIHLPFCFHRSILHWAYARTHHWIEPISVYEHSTYSLQPLVWCH